MHFVALAGAARPTAERISDMRRGNDRAAGGSYGLAINVLDRCARRNPFGQAVKELLDIHGSYAECDMENRVSDWQQAGGKTTSYTKVFQPCLLNRSSA